MAQASTEHEPGCRRRASLRRLLSHPTTATGVVVALSALAFVQTGLARANADTLLGPLMSTRRLTFYYWDQNRLANVIPALAAVIRSPEANLYLQLALVAAPIGALYCGFLILHTKAFGVQNPWVIPFGTALLAASTALWMEPSAIHEFTIAQHYGFAYMLLFGGFALLGRDGRRAALGAILVVTATVMNPSTVLFVPIAVAGFLLAQRANAALRGLAVAVVGFGVSVIASRTFGAGESASYFEYDFGRTLSNWGVVIGGITDTLTSGFVRAIVVGALVVTAFASPRARWWWAVVALATITAFGWVVVFSGVRWVEINSFHFRYFFPIQMWIMFIAAMGLAAASALIERRIGRREPSPRVAAILTAVGLAAVPATVIQFVELEEIDIIARVSTHVDAASSTDSRYIVGYYWEVWPTVLALANRGHLAYGVTHRGAVLRAELRKDLDEELTSGSPVPVVCVAVSPTECRDQFSSFTGIDVVRVDAGAADNLIYVVPVPET